MKPITILGFSILLYILLSALFCLDLQQLLKYAPLATFTLGLLAFTVAIRTYYRKSAIGVKSYFIPNQSSHYGKTYIQSYSLESEKDKAISIFRTYLRIGFDTYILLEDFRDKPLILKAYEIHHKEFDRLHWYTSNEHKLDLSEVINDPKIEKRIVLSTSQGKYITQTNKHPWYAEISKMNYNLIHGANNPSLQGYSDWKNQSFISLGTKDISKNIITFLFRKLVEKIKYFFQISNKKLKELVASLKNKYRK